MAKSTKKRHSAPRDPLITRAKKTLKTSKTLKSKKRRKPVRSSSASQPLVPAIARLPPPLAVGPAAMVLDRLWSVVLSRRSADPAVSHSARLLSRGTSKVAQKFGEEAVECLIEAVAGNRDALVAESADVLYHLLVVLHARGIKLDEVEAELGARTRQSGLDEKASRKSG